MNSHSAGIARHSRRARNWLSRLFEKQGDATAVVTDAIAFLVYFSSSLFVGGATYNHAYNYPFQYAVRNSFDVFRTSLEFFTTVLWGDGYAWLVALLAIVFSVLFYLARFVWRMWLGYLALSLCLFSSVVICAVLGDRAGGADGSRDLLESTTHLPIVKVYLIDQESRKTGPADEDFGDGSYHLITEDSETIKIFVPPSAANGEFKVVELKRSDIETIETIQ